jgi:antitoxin HicB
MSPAGRGNKGGSVEVRRRMEFERTLEREAPMYAVVIEQANKNLSTYAPDLPGAVATGRDRAEVIENMRSALLLHLLGLHESGEATPRPTPWEELQLQVELDPSDEVVWLEPEKPDPVSTEILWAIERSQLSQAEVARRMGTSRSTISRLTNPVYHGHSLQTLRRLGEVLDLNLCVSLESRERQEARQ